MKKQLLLFTCCVLSSGLWAQEILQTQIADSSKISRSDWQSLFLIEREQKKIDFADGVKDEFLNIDDDMIRSNAISKAVFDDTKKSLYYILNNFNDNQQKRDFLNNIAKQLKELNRSIDLNKFNINKYKRVLELNYNFLRAIYAKRSDRFIERNAGSELYSLSPMLFHLPAIKQKLVQETAKVEPEILLYSLKEIRPPSLVDEIVTEASKRQPKMILNYVTSTAPERRIVRRNEDAYVKSLVKLADESKTPLKSIFFLDEFYKKRKTISQINAITASKKLYYKNLVKLINDSSYVNKRQAIGKELSQETKGLVHTMNELHNASDATRFKVISNFNGAETYYVMVYGDEQFYTSSFLGVSRRLMSRMSPKNGSAFLDKMNLTKFRTFIRLNANYNTLNTFLKSMKKAERTALIKKFVNGLEDTGERSLEGAIDVANTYSSIKDTNIQNLIIEEVQRNRSRCNLADNSFGYRIYHILNTMFTGTPETISKELGIPPISLVTHKALENDSGIIAHQIFFPGDKDGKGVFNGFVRRHSNGAWRIVKKEKWIEFHSKKGAKVVKYANKPFDEPEDEFAQKELNQYLLANNIKPSIVIQRGHSYHVQNTLDLLNADHKVVVLGACGGFNHLETIMKKSPDAQIISSKQIGSGSVNWPILTYMDKELAKGNDINWVKMWNQLDKQIGGSRQSLFDDYVPPHKNLGSLFLKAYYQAELSE